MWLSLARAPGLGPGGRRFESCHPDKSVSYTHLDVYKRQILYCERGGISLMAAKHLGNEGYHVKTVVGGILAYRGRYLETE